jgi:hypothetical protein
VAGLAAISLAAYSPELIKNFDPSSRDAQVLVDRSTPPLVFNRNDKARTVNVFNRVARGKLTKHGGGSTMLRAQGGQRLSVKRDRTC